MKKLCMLDSVLLMAVRYYSPVQSNMCKHATAHATKTNQWNGMSFHTQIFHKMSDVKGLHEKISALQIKKRSKRKKKGPSLDTAQPGFWSVKAIATADEYNLEGLIDGLIKQDLYKPAQITTSPKLVSDAVQAIARYEVGSEPREIFFFREGTTVMWNMSDLECNNLLQFLKQYEDGSYSYDLIHLESETALYTYTESGKKSHMRDGDIFLLPNSNLDKYTFSNALSQSVKLGIWEASLDDYVDSIEFITEDLKAGKRIQMTRQEVLRRQGELLALRHLINLSSDLLDTPDFYWERDDLENLYQRTCGYYNIAKRTKVMNEKISHCIELVELLSSHLSDRHHIRLEWMIIVLIMVEVGFEVLHYLDRYLAKQENENTDDRNTAALPNF